MNVVYKFELDEELKKRWYDFWIKCEHAHPQQHWLYGEIERSKGRIPVYVYGETNGELKCIGIFSIRPLLSGNKYSLQALCYRGPAFDDISILNEFLIDVKEYFKTLMVGNIVISPYWFTPEADEIVEILHNLGFKPTSLHSYLIVKLRHITLDILNKTSIIDLDRSEEELLDSFSKSTRREIRRAERSDIVVRSIKDSEETYEFYKHFRDMSIDRGLNLPSKDEFKGTFENILKGGEFGVLLHAYHENAFLGGLWMLRGPTTAHTNRYVVSRQPLKELSNLRIGPFLWWQGFLWAKEMGCRYIDMEGSFEDVNESDPMYRVNKFKKGFNPTLSYRINDHQCTCNSITMSILEGLKLWSKISRTMKSIIQRSK